MTLMVCLDDRNGLMFNKRRQSRDAAVVADAVAFASPEKLTVDSYSAELFRDHEVSISDVPFSEGLFCFAEQADFAAVRPKVDRLVVYRWNRSYPADLSFPLADYLKSMTLRESLDFPGNSHDRITREVYTV